MHNGRWLCIALPRIYLGELLGRQGILMSPDVMILKDGLPAFHRTYGGRSLENIELRGGLYAALLQFSSVEVGENLESIRTSNSLVHFKTNGNFTFIIIEGKDTAMGSDKLKMCINYLVEHFNTSFPNAAQWQGDLSYFDSFTRVCDDVFQAHPGSRGFSVLYKIEMKIIGISPVSHAIPPNPSTERSQIELQTQLKNYLKEFGIQKLKSSLRRGLTIALPGTNQLAYIVGFDVELKRKDITHILCLIIAESEWQVFYQLIRQYFNKFTRLLPTLVTYLLEMRNANRSEFVEKNKSAIQELLNDWGDLNVYLGDMEASLAETLFRSNIPSEVLSDGASRETFYHFITHFGRDVD